jgi:hypothetical protein
LADGTNSTILRGVDNRWRKMTPASSGGKAITGGGGTANSRLKLGRQVSVYLETDADLDECWGGPEHVTSSFCDDVGDGYFPCG